MLLAFAGACSSNHDRSTELPQRAPTANPNLRGLLLAPTDLPAGYVVQNNTSDPEFSAGPGHRDWCKRDAPGWHLSDIAEADIQFENAHERSGVGETLLLFRTASDASRYVAATDVKDCNLEEGDGGAPTTTTRVTGLSFPRLADDQRASRISFPKAEGQPTQATSVDTVVVRQGRIVMEVVVFPDLTSHRHESEAIVRAAVQKIKAPT